MDFWGFAFKVICLSDDVVPIHILFFNLNLSFGIEVIELVLTYFKVPRSFSTRVRSLFFP